MTMQNEHEKLSFHQKMFSKNKESGQSIIEFVLLMMVIVGLSFMLRSGINRALFVYWENYVKIIAAPTDSNIQLIE